MKYTTKIDIQQGLINILSCFYQTLVKCFVFYFLYSCAFPLKLTYTIAKTCMFFLFSHIKTYTGSRAVSIFVK